MEADLAALAQRCAGLPRRGPRRYAFWTTRRYYSI